MDAVAEQQADREQVPGQQEVQDLPAAVRQLQEAECPAMAENVDVRRRLLRGEGLPAGRNDEMILPIRGVVRACLRVSEDCATKSGVVLRAGRARRGTVHRLFGSRFECPLIAVW